MSSLTRFALTRIARGPGRWLVPALIAVAAAPLAAQNKPDAVWTTSVQTGFADTFQLTLGGMFGDGPAWQNKVTSGINNMFRTGDSFSLYGWNSLDTPSHINNWQAGFGYKLPVLKKGRHSLVLGSGLQRWLFPRVKTGAKDWLIPGTLAYSAGLSNRMSFLVTDDSWTLLKSTLPLGSLLHTQTWLQYDLVKRERLKISFKNGPAHTYSWNFYGTNGNRVVRYQTMLTIAYKNTTIEGGYRKQWGLQDGIADNKFWQFAVTRTFSHPLGWR